MHKLRRTFIKPRCTAICMGYRLSVRSRWLDIGQVLFLRVYGPRRSRGPQTGKKERGQYPAILTEQTWSIKDLLYGFWGNFACGIQRVVPSGQDRSILPARVANHSARFRSSCLLAACTCVDNRYLERYQ